LFLDTGTLLSGSFLPAVFFGGQQGDREVAENRGEGEGRDLPLRPGWAAGGRWGGGCGLHRFPGKYVAPAGGGGCGEEEAGFPPGRFAQREGERRQKGRPAVFHRQPRREAGSGGQRPGAFPAPSKGADMPGARAGGFHRQVFAGGEQLAPAAAEAQRFVRQVKFYPAVLPGVQKFSGQGRLPAAPPAAGRRRGR